eukprot:3319379-Alexandrium_andersonii.AAC.1
MAGAATGRLEGRTLGAKKLRAALGRHGGRRVGSRRPACWSDSGVSARAGRIWAVATTLVAAGCVAFAGVAGRLGGA